MADFQSTRFGKYLLLEKIAAGGMAQLYRAKITGVQGFERLIAIKMILPHLLGEKELINSFIDEAKLAALLNHQNIVQIYDFGQMEDSYYIAMEYLLGKDLRQVLQKSKERELPLNVEQALYVISRICSGLDYVHKLKDFHGKPLNIIHRDISPQNIFITYEGEVKIVDFGIAKAASQSTVTQHGMIKGKVAYMSPEQASGEMTDLRSDIFSTGILLYELVTHKRMFIGDTLQILAKVREAEFEPPEKALQGLSPKLYNILHRALAKEPEQRYQSCGEMLSDLEECMFELSLRPTARGLARYMKGLFEEEIEAEGVVIGDSETIIPDQSPTPEKGLQLDENILEKAEPAAGEKELPKPRKRLFLYAALAAAVVLIAVILAFWPKEKGGSAPSKEAARPPVSKPSKEPAPVKVASTKPEKKPEKVADPSAEARALQGQAAEVMEKSPEQAKSLLLQAIKLDPKSAQVHFELGLAYMKLKDPSKAIEAYQKATELNPQFPDAYFNLGYVYAMDKNYSKAEEMYGQVVKLAPPYLDEALFNLGMVQAKQGKRQQSIENLERALEVNPQNEMARKYLDNLKKKS